VRRGFNDFTGKFQLSNHPISLGPLALIWQLGGGQLGKAQMPRFSFGNASHFFFWLFGMMV
jgi:hypothetical protein